MVGKNAQKITYSGLLSLGKNRDTLGYKMNKQVTHNKAEDITATPQEGTAVSAADQKIETSPLSELRYGLTVQEIAERLGISVQNAQALIIANSQRNANSHELRGR